MHVFSIASRLGLAFIFAALARLIGALQANQHCEQPAQSSSCLLTCANQSLSPKTCTTTKDMKCLCQSAPYNKVVVACFNKTHQGEIVAILKYAIARCASLGCAVPPAALAPVDELAQE